MAGASFRPLFFGGESKQGTRTTERRDETKQKESTVHVYNRAWNLTFVAHPQELSSLIIHHSSLISLVSCV